VLAGRPAPTGAVRNGPRTGVGGDGADHPWRYWIDGEPSVSPYRAHTPRKRR
jgi:DNA-3-methyladenine glycosylase